MTGSSKLIFGMAPIIVLLMILFSTNVSAFSYTYVTNPANSVFFSSCGGTCYNATGSNDTNWNSYAWVQCGGSPCGSSELLTNYTYDWRWLNNNTGNITIIYKYNSSYGNTFFKIWNWTSSSWQVCNWWAMMGTVRNITCIITPSAKADWLKENQPLMIDFSGTVNINSNGTFYESMVTWNITAPYISNCSNSSPTMSPYLTYTCKNELTTSNVNCDLDTSLLISGGNKSFQFRNNYTYQVCLEPNNTAYVLNATSKYSNISYSTRYHFLENANVSSNQAMTLYLLNSSDSTLIAMIIKDQVENPVENEIVLIQKQDLGTGTYTQVAEAKSDFSGYAYTYLKMHEIYKFFLIKNGIVQREFEPMQLESTTLTFYVSQIDTPEYFSYYNNVATSCTNVSNNLTCSWVDTSGLTADMNLYVGKIDQVGETTFCDYTDSSSSGTFVCDLSSGGNFRYVLKGTYHSNPITYVWQSGYIGGASVVDFGVVGLVLTLLIVMFVSYMTHNDVKLCLISTAFALIFCSVISLIRFGADAMAMTFTVGIISGIVAFKIRF